jgi:hypothetical protein
MKVWRGQWERDSGCGSVKICEVEPMHRTVVVIVGRSKKGRTEVRLLVVEGA